MPKNTILQAKLLTYAGTIPFLAFLISQQLGYLYDPMIIISYSSLIISFICGAHWATFIFFSKKTTLNLLFTSNFITLLAWVSLLSKNVYVQFFIHTLSFMFLLVIDSKLTKLLIIPSWFYSLRKKVTVIVITLLNIIFFFL